MVDKVDIARKAWYERLDDHPLYDPEIHHSDWEDDITRDRQFEWLLDNVQFPFGVIFCDYYYIICFTSEADAAFFKLTWFNPVDE